MSFSRTLKEKTKKIWEDGYNHPFVQGLGEGTLDKEAFKFYLIQDYIYLLGYAKVFAKGAIKANSEFLMAKFTEAQYGIICNEMSLHREYMKEFGITTEEAEVTKQSLFNRAYTSNMMSIAETGDVTEILAVIFPCAWTYYDYAVRLKEQYKDNLEDNFYHSWIESYSSDEFYKSFDWFYDEIDRQCENKTEEELRTLEEIFEMGVQMEYLFWDMAYKQNMSY
nr:thiaminase II [Clostridioides sp.]